MSKSYLRKNRIAGQFAARTIAMLESPAFQVLSLAGHRVLARIEIELAHHGGNDNGRLPVTFDHFAEYGMDRHAIGSRVARGVRPRLRRDHRAGSGWQRRMATAKQIQAHLPAHRSR